jgi:hypothetical protein
MPDLPYSNRSAHVFSIKRGRWQVFKKQSVLMPYDTILPLIYIKGIGIGHLTGLPGHVSIKGNIH